MSQTRGGCVMSRIMREVPTRVAGRAERREARVFGEGGCLVYSAHRGQGGSREAALRVGGPRWEPGMGDELQTRVTQVLQDKGRREEELLPLVYDQLKAIAQKRMGGERQGHTLQATALVHEAYMRLIGDQGMNWESRAHFYGAAAEAMRRILIDHARKRDSQKRGGGKKALPISVVDLAEDFDPAQVIAVDEAVTALEGEDARAAEVVRYRFFAGLSVEETAEVMGVSERTVMREWSFARARLFELLGDSSGAGDEA